ncbi:hypothetical protein HAX54_004295 [Datura stramonium]|uniref:DUF1985 domain-containing protein n=1 Tax=Datura stramonium TaxID=4076 RepID=A0ABS8WUX2_DATST|nr:hypothetical protein [Datura stramonium]
MGRKRHALSRWWGHRPLDFSDFSILADDCIGEHESIASVMSGPTFSLLGDESQSVFSGSANSSRGESNIGHANVAPDVRVLYDKGIDEHAKLKGKATIAEHYSVDENVKLKGKEKWAEHCSVDENDKLQWKEKMTEHYLSDENTKVLDMSYFHLVETGDFNGYPWGIDVFHATFESCSNKFKIKPEFYRYGGFLLTL